MISRSSTARTSVMALDALWPVGRALSRVLQKHDEVNGLEWAGLAIDTESWREMLVLAQPDVALIDPLGFGRTTDELVLLTHRVSPETKIIVFVPTIAEPIVQRWYDAGADACITKCMHPALILEVIESVREDTFDRAALSERLWSSSASA